jgi:6-phosphofructokinase 1
MVIEVFGRYAGHTAFRGGIAADADCILIPEVPMDFDIVYEHMKKTFMRRVAESEYKAGTYVIVAAEGMSDITGQSITDDSVAVDSFGHKKLSGVGKYVREQLTQRIKNDPGFIEFMKKQGLYVEKMNEVPQVRETVPGYLVRSGSTSALDANFGKDTGAGAVLLLLKGISGVTVTGLYEGNIEYIPTETAIEQRHVSEGNISFYEQWGICFGRKPFSCNYECIGLKKATWSYL